MRRDSLFVDVEVTVDYRIFTVVGVGDAGRCGDVW
jgi:hypothetical protein